MELDIRGNTKDIIKLKKIKTTIKNIDFTIDDKLEFPIIMIQNEKSELVEYLRSYKLISNYLKYGYNRIIKKCPYRHRKCIGEKCSLYYIENGTGDCVHVWQMFKK